MFKNFTWRKSILILFLDPATFSKLLDDRARTKNIKIRRCGKMFRFHIRRINTSYH